MGGLRLDGRGDEGEGMRVTGLDSAVDGGARGINPGVDRLAGYVVSDNVNLSSRTSSEAEISVLSKGTS